MGNQFEHIHFMLKGAKKGEFQYEDILELIFNEIEWKVNYPFDANRNHAWYIIGDIYFKLQEYKKAEKAFSASLEADPSDVSAMMALANCYSELQKPDLAGEMLNRALLLRPGDADLLYNLGNTYFDEGAFGEALRAYGEIGDVDDEFRSMIDKNIKRCRQRKNKRPL